MKPAPFDYQAPATLQEAINLLAAEPEAVLIAGGQSLMPVLAFRLASPRSTLSALRAWPRTNVIKPASYRPVETCGARDITPSQPSPIEGEGSRMRLPIGAAARRRAVI